MNNSRERDTAMRAQALERARDGFLKKGGKMDVSQML